MSGNNMAPSYISVARRVTIGGESTCVEVWWYVRTKTGRIIESHGPMPEDQYRDESTVAAAALGIEVRDE